MPPPLPPSGQSPQQPDMRRGDPPSGSPLRRPMPTLPEPTARRESTLIWVQTVLLGLICAGIMVMIHKIMDPKTLGEKIAPLFANLFGATVLVALLQLIRGKAWSWPLVGFAILMIAFLGMQLTLWVVSHLGIKPG